MEQPSAAEVLLAHVQHAQQHVLAAVDGLDAQRLREVRVPSGWSIEALLGHLTYDDEVFWIHAVLAGEPDAIARLRDGWSARPAEPQDAVAAYRAAVEHSRELLATLDLDAPPRWWPPADVFPFPPFASGCECVWRLLTETLTHAGHLDVARELIDGHQHLVVG